MLLNHCGFIEVTMYDTPAGLGFRVIPSPAPFTFLHNYSYNISYVLYMYSMYIHTLLHYTYEHTDTRRAKKEMHLEYTIGMYICMYG